MSYLCEDDPLWQSFSGPLGLSSSLWGETSLRVGGDTDPWVTTKRCHVQIDCTMKRNLPLWFPIWWNFQTTVCLTVLWERYDLFILKENPSLFRLTVMRPDILLRPSVTLNYPVFKHENKLDPAVCILHNKNDMATKTSNLIEIFKHLNSAGTQDAGGWLQWLICS